MKNISIIGSGRLGTALGRALLKKGYNVRILCCRTLASARESARIIGHGRTTTKAERAAREDDILFICLPDDAIEKAAGQLARSRVSWNDKIVFQCSGRLSAKILSALSQKGAATGSFHPVQSFARKEDPPELFKNIYFGLEGHPKAVEAAERIVRKLGGHTLLLTEKEKPLYHASCVLCSGGITALLKTAFSILEKAGLGEKEALSILSPLIQRTLHNVKEIGVDNALTGPIVRGDIGTVTDHLKAFPALDAARDIYKAVGLVGLEIAMKKKRIPQKTISALKKILKDK